MHHKEKLFALMFRRHYDAMYRFAFSFLRDYEESRDVVSEVFARLWDEGTALKKETQHAFLLSCVRNRCLNLIARKGRDEKLRKLYPMQLSNVVGPDDEEDRRIEELLNAIDHDLTPQARRILRMRYGEGQSYREIAEALGISVSTVNKHVVQALKELRAKFSGHRRGHRDNNKTIQ